jgi:RimJ/RimL family protein N-acetyltransferase
MEQSTRPGLRQIDGAVLRVGLKAVERHELALVEPWFRDPDTNRWLGDSNWPAMMLDLQQRPLGEFRGMQELARHLWLAWHDGAPVGYVNCGVHDRWTTWEGGPEGRGVVATIQLVSGAVGYVVDPARRRHGFGVAMLRSLIEREELAHVQLFAAGIEPDNTASVRYAERAGYRPLDPAPDFEGIVHYVYKRATA